MFWIITVDHINGKTPDDTPSRVGTFGTSGNALLREALRAASADARPHMLAGCKGVCDHEFRLFDDDGNLYYEGLCYRLDKASADAAFEPLDWAEADAGCTRMDYRKKGETEWKTL